MMPKKNFGIFSSLTKFEKRWSTIMIMLESSEGGKRESKFAEGRATLGSPSPPP